MSDLLKINLVIALFLGFSAIAFCQDKKQELLAAKLFEESNYPMATEQYKDLLAQNPSNLLYYKNLFTCYLKSDNLKSADSLARANYSKYNSRKHLLIDLGYVCKLQGDSTKSEDFYKQALQSVEKYPNSVYSIAFAFGQYYENQWALKCYYKIKGLSNKTFVDIQIANLHAEIGNVDSMLFYYLQSIENSPNSYNSIKRYLERYLLSSPNENEDEKLKIALIKKTQSSNSELYTELLAWYFEQKDEHYMAFVQLRSLYLQNRLELSAIVELANNATAKKDFETAREILKFVLEKTDDREIIQLCKLKIIETEIQQKLPFNDIEASFENALQEKYTGPNRFNTIKSYCLYLSASGKNSTSALQKAKSLTKEFVDIEQYKAPVALLIGDLQLRAGNLDDAFMEYQKAENKSNEGQTKDLAKLKSLKVAFYKGEINWAKQIAQVYKKSSSKWYSNDAAEMFVILESAYYSDSTDISTKKFARAEYFYDVEKLDSARSIYSEIASNYPKSTLSPIAMYKISEIDQKMGNFEQSAQGFKIFYENYPNNTLAPFALLNLSELYLHYINNTEEAKLFLKELLTYFPDHFLADKARKLYSKSE